MVNKLFLKQIENIFSGTEYYIKLTNKNYIIGSVGDRSTWFHIQIEDMSNNLFLNRLEEERIEYYDVFSNKKDSESIDIYNRFNILYNLLIVGLDRKEKIKRIIKEL